MQVETFQCSETASEPIEACEEAIRLMEEMELAGQQELIKPKEDGEMPARCPYREMTQDERFVYGVLCPGITAIERYRLGPIPLRVLQIAAHAMSLKVYKQLEVWHAKEAAVPDPVLVGIVPDPQYSYSVRARHILARWGEELESWPTLLKRAVEAKRAQVKDIYATLQRRLAALALEDELPAEELIAKGAEWKPELRI